MKHTTVIIALMVSVLLTGCDESRNPVSSLPDGAAVVWGNLCDAEKNNGVLVTLHGSKDYYAVTDFRGNYVFCDVSFGNYTIIPDGNQYKFYPANYKVKVDNTYIRVPKLIGYVEPQAGHKVIGIARENSGLNVEFSEPPVSFDLFNNGRNIAYKGTMSFSGGDIAYAISFSDNSITTVYTMRAYLRNQIIHMDPDSVQIEIDAPVLFQDWEYTYIGPTCYTVSGYVGSTHDIGGIIAEFIKIDDTSGSISSTYLTYLSSDGYFEFTGIPKGLYRINIDKGSYEILADYPDTITVNDDIILPAMQIRYSGSNTVTIRGRVLDRDDIGISGATIIYNNEWGVPLKQIMTDVDGEYEFDVTVAPDKSVPVQLQVSKSGVAFANAEQSLILVWEPDVRERVVEAPDFVGTDYTAITAMNFFPLDTVTRWTYRRTTGGNISNVDMTLSKTGDGWFRFTPRGPADFQEFRIMDNNVDVRDSSGKMGTLLRWGVTPGTIWKIFPGQEYQAWHGEFLGFEDVTIPAGAYGQCAVFEAGIDWDSQSDTTFTLWFSPDIGLVKMTRISRSKGEVVESRIDELLSID